MVRSALFCLFVVACSSSDVTDAWPEPDERESTPLPAACDLEITGAGALLDAVRIGGDLPIGVTVDNAGDADCPAFDLRVDLANAEEADAVPLCVTTCPPIAAGESAGCEAECPTLDVPEGRYRLAAWADPDDDIEESNEANNALADADELEVLPADVRIAISNFAIGGDLVYGEPFAVGLNVHNEGSVPVDDLALDLWLADAETLDQHPTCRLALDEGLEPGDSQFVAFHCEPPAVRSGSYTVGIAAFGGWGASDAEATAASEVMAVEGPSWDLQPVQITAEGHLEAGHPADFGVVIENIGDDDAEGPEIELWLSEDGELQMAEDLPVCTTFTDGVPAREARATAFNCVLPEIAEGGWHLLVVVDPRDELPEEDEANNVLASAPVDIR